MKVTVNEEIVEGPACGAATLRDLIDCLRGDGRIGDDQVVAAIEVDRRPWGPGDMDRLGAPLAGPNEVSIRTEGMAGYARRILQDATGMLRVLKEANRCVAAGLRSGDPATGNRDLFQLLEALQNFLNCLGSVQMACGGDGVSVPPRRTVMALLSAALDTVADCQRREDWPALADQLDQHLMPALEGFEDVIAAMNGQV